MKRFTITHCLLAITWIVIALVIASQFWRKPPFEGYTDDIVGLYLEDELTGRDFAIDEELVDQTPIWSAAYSNPPLSAREALAIANRVLKQRLKETKYDTWYLEYIALYPLDGKNGKWCWFVLFNMSLKPGEFGGGSGPPTQYGTYILMDGTVVALENGEYFDSLEYMGLTRDPDEED